VLGALAAVLMVAEGSRGQEWTQWRGPARDGSVAAESAPERWPGSFRPAWRVEVGEGYSSPVVAGGRVFVHARRDPNEIVVALDLATGRVLWQQEYAAAFSKNQYAVRMAKGPNSTPALVGARLFTLGMTGVLSAWDAASGRLVWRKDYSSAIDTSKLFCGTSMSPLVEGGALVVQVGSDVHGGRVITLDPATGAERWTWRGAGPGYASPIALVADGTRQIVTMTDSSSIGIDAATGASLWSVPFPDEWHENIVTPIWTGTHLVVSGTRQGTHAYSVRRGSGGWEAVQAWKNPDVAMYMSTPVLADGILYGHSARRKGQFVAIDASTGAVRWATEGREGAHASVLLTPQHVVYLTEGADLIVVRRSADRFDALHRYDVADSATWGMPVLLRDGLVVRDEAGLARLTHAPADGGGRAAHP
jgi:outer membrane protein assembly factor BamB